MYEPPQKLEEIITAIANSLEEYDSTRPVHKQFQPGIGPFGEPQLVQVIASRLNIRFSSWLCKVQRTPDLAIQQKWALEFKIVRPFGDNGKEAENWSVNLLHPYEGNTSLLGDAVKLSKLYNFDHKAVVAIGYEHLPPKISIEPLLRSFELIAEQVVNIQLGPRIEEKRFPLIHPEHQLLRCVGWKVLAT